MSTLPVALFSREQLNRHASIGGYVIVDHDGRNTICELQGWGSKARVQFPSRNIRSLPLHAVTGVIDPVYVADTTRPVISSSDGLKRVSSQAAPLVAGTIGVAETQRHPEAVGPASGRLDQRIPMEGLI